MTRVIILLLATVFFKSLLNSRRQRTANRIKPYASVFDVAVPSDLACSPLCDPLEMMSRSKQAHRH